MLVCRPITAMIVLLMVSLPVLAQGGASLEDTVRALEKHVVELEDRLALLERRYRALSGAATSGGVTVGGGASGGGATVSFGGASTSDVSGPGGRYRRMAEDLEWLSTIENVPGVVLTIDGSEVIVSVPLTEEGFGLLDDPAFVQPNWLDDRSMTTLTIPGLSLQQTDYLMNTTPDGYLLDLWRSADGGIATPYSVTLRVDDFVPQLDLRELIVVPTAP